MDAKELLQLHDEITKRCKSIMERKNSDYTGGSKATDALSNFKGSRTLGIHPVMGLLLRVQDKMKRIESFVADGELRVTGEPVQDACDDCVNYFILAAALLKEEAEKLSTEESSVPTDPENDWSVLPDGFIQICRDSPLHHRPQTVTNDVMYRDCLGNWVFFEPNQAPIHCDYAVRMGSQWDKLNTAEIERG